MLQRFSTQFLIFFSSVLFFSVYMTFFFILIAIENNINFDENLTRFLLMRKIESSYKNNLLTPRIKTIYFRLFLRVDNSKNKICNQIYKRKELSS